MRKHRSILSVDFDYFYPDSIGYDWGHSEHRGKLMAAIIWQTRAGSRHLISGETALESYVPSVPVDFWDRVLQNRPRLYVADSHLMIWKRLEEGTQTSVVNVDAHHDCGYKPLDFSSRTVNVDCSNWGAIGAIMGKISGFHQVYPKWRKKTPEVKPDCGLPNSTRYSLPGPKKYDEVFICRSGAWTPPWYDDAFWAFVKALKTPYETLDDVEESRDMNLQQAKAVAAQWNKMLEDSQIHSNKEAFDGAH